MAPVETCTYTCHDAGLSVDFGCVTSSSLAATLATADVNLPWLNSSSTPVYPVTAPPRDAAQLRNRAPLGAFDFHHIFTGQARGSGVAEVTKERLAACVGASAAGSATVPTSGTLQVRICADSLDNVSGIHLVAKLATAVQKIQLTGPPQTEISFTLDGTDHLLHVEAVEEGEHKPHGSSATAIRVTSLLPGEWHRRDVHLRGYGGQLKFEVRVEYPHGSLLVEQLLQRSGLGLLSSAETGDLRAPDCVTGTGKPRCCITLPEDWADGIGDAGEGAQDRVRSRGRGKSSARQLFCAPDDLFEEPVLKVLDPLGGLASAWEFNARSYSVNRAYNASACSSSAWPSADKDLDEELSTGAAHTSGEGEKTTSAEPKREAGAAGKPDEQATSSDPSVGLSGLFGGVSLSSSGGSAAEKSSGGASAPLQCKTDAAAGGLGTSGTSSSASIFGGSSSNSSSSSSSSSAGFGFSSSLSVFGTSSSSSSNGSSSSTAGFGFSSSLSVFGTSSGSSASSSSMSASGLSSSQSLFGNLGVSASFLGSSSSLSGSGSSSSSSAAPGVSSSGAALLPTLSPASSAAGLFASGSASSSSSASATGASIAGAASSSSTGLFPLGASPLGGAFPVFGQSSSSSPFQGAAVAQSSSPFAGGAASLFSHLGGTKPQESASAAPLGTASSPLGGFGLGGPSPASGAQLLATPTAASSGGPACPTPTPCPATAQSAAAETKLGYRERCTQLVTSLQQAEESLQNFRRDPSQKEFRLTVKKKLNTKVSQISATWNRIRDCTGSLNETLSQYLREGQGPRCKFVEYAMAERLADDAEVGIKAQPRAAWAVAQVTVRIFAQFPVVKALFWGLMYRACPYLIPSFLGSQAGRTGPASAQRANEPFSEFAQRMVSYQRLHVAIHVIGGDLGAVWEWLARTLNEPPTPVAAPLLHAALEVAGSDAQARYRRQFVKLVAYIDREYMRELEGLQGKVRGEEADQLRASNSRLRQWLDVFRTSGRAPPPDGRHIEVMEEAELNPDA